MKQETPDPVNGVDPLSRKPVLPDRRAPTSQDVAQLANVSRATVSYVLNDTPNTRISKATRKRVLKAAQKLGYVPHEIASSLRAGRSDMVLLPFFDWPYNQSSITFLQELAKNLDRLGYSVMLRFFGSTNQKLLARKIASIHPIGVLVEAGELTPSDVDILHRNGVRAILAYEGRPGALVPSVAIDFTQVGECVGRHLASRSYRNIAVIVPRDPRIIELGLQRLHGLENISKVSNLKIERIDLDYDPAQVASVAARWKQGSHPDAVFTYNDEYDMLLMSSLQAVGLNVPADIALVGCDDLPLCELTRPRLTSVNLGSVSRAREIATYFDQIIRGEAHTSSPQISFDCKLILRESG